MSTIGQDTRFNTPNGDELMEDASSVSLSDEEVTRYLTRISEEYDKDLVMTMTIHDVVFETPWGPEVKALLGEFGHNSKVKIAKYFS